MTIEDALRKIALLRRISTDKGALAAERETAYRLQKALMARYAIKNGDVPEGPTATTARLNWSYWEELFGEFDLRLVHFGNRGSAKVGNTIAYIKLATSQWWIEEPTSGGMQTTIRGRGIDSLRKYLKEHAPRNYSFLRR
jgi:hypothetical protein